MNIKLNNEDRSQDFLEPEPFSSAEERRRTGRYVAILVGISLVCLAIYHAWVRRIPVLASLLVPALIMLLYIAWVLYTASRDKKIEFDPEQGLETVIGLLPRPPHANVDVIPVEPPPCTTATVTAVPVSSAMAHSSKENKQNSTVVKKTTIVLPPPIQKEKNLKRNVATSPKDPNSPKEFRRCYSIT